MISRTLSLRAGLAGLALTFAALTCAALASGAARAEDAAARSCFFAHQVNGFSPVDRTHVRLKVNAGDVYELTLFAPCPEIRWTQGIQLRVAGGGSSVCEGSSVDIVTSDLGQSEVCRVESIRKVAPADLQDPSAPDVPSSR